MNKETKLEVTITLIEKINQETGLHIQIFYEEPKCFDSMMAHYGNFSGVKNYIALVGKKSPKLDETLGYYGENQGVPHKNKALQTVCNHTETMPEWFLYQNGFGNRQISF